MIVNRPYALYYNGELIGIITNADAHSDIHTICDCLSPDDGLADVREIDPNALRIALAPLMLDETIDLPDEDED